MATAVSSLNDVWGGSGGYDTLRQKKAPEAAELKQQELKQQELKQQELKQQELKQQELQRRKRQQLEQHRALLRHLSILQQQNDMLKQELLSRTEAPLAEANTADHAVIAITLFSVLLLVVIVGFTILGCKLNKVSNSLRYVMARFGMPIH